MKLKIIILIFVLSACLACNTEYDRFKNYFEQAHKMSIKQSDTILFLRFPGCHSCNKKMYAHITSHSYNKSFKLIFNCAYPDTHMLSTLKRRFGEKVVWERKDTIRSIIPNLGVSGSIHFDKKGKAIVRLFETNTNPKIFFSE